MYCVIYMNLCLLCLELTLRVYNKVDTLYGKLMLKDIMHMLSR